MPKKSRTPAEVEEIKQQILNTAVDIISEDGYENFSMRKLAGRLNLSATAIYKYYANKDELYLAIVTQGFELLHNELTEAYNLGCTPEERVRFVGKRYIEFGLKNAHMYDAMMILNVPKFVDFVGTSMEAAAAAELSSVRRVIVLCKKIVEELGLAKTKSPEETEMTAFELICLVHGMVSLMNSHAAYYTLDSRVDDTDKLIDNFLDVVIDDIISK